MHRCLVNPGDWESDLISLSRAESHHLVHVLRVRDGDNVGVFDGHGREALACVELADDAACLRILGERHSMQPVVDVTLLQALPKGGRMDVIVEKGTELGIRTFVPVVTERVVVRLDRDQSQKRVERWRRLAVSAARQCGLSTVPEVKPVMALADAVACCADADLFLVGSLREDARPLREVLRGARCSSPRRVAMLIGPEGDLSTTELGLAAGHGALPVSFGPLTLRVDTAALFAAGVLAYELGG